MLFASGAIYRVTKRGPLLLRNLANLLPHSCRGASPSCTITECSPVGLSTAVCGAEPIVPWFSAGLCEKSDRVSDKAESCTRHRVRSLQLERRSPAVRLESTINLSPVAAKLTRLEVSAVLSRTPLNQKYSFVQYLRVVPLTILVVPITILVVPITSPLLLACGQGCCLFVGNMAQRPEGACHLHG